MGKTIYGMFWILSLVMVFLVSNSALFAQSPVETTTQGEQGSVDIQQQDIDQQNQAATTSYYYLYLRSLECNYSNYDYAYLKVNGKIVWGPEELSVDTGGIMISIDPIQVNKAKIELYANSTASSKSAKYVNKIYLTLNDLKNLVDQGEKTYNLTKRYLWNSSEYFDYTLALEVSSTNDDSYAFVGNASIHDENKSEFILSASDSLSNYYTDGSLNPFVWSYTGQCTWYVYGRIQEKGLATRDYLNSKSIFTGNATSWDDDARNAGFEVNTTPKANAIAVWEGSYGHVAFVEEVSGSSIKVTESNKPQSKWGKGQKVVVTKPWNLRDGYSTSSNIVWEMPKGTIMEIIGGPKTKDRYKWWQLSGNGYSGWSAISGSGVEWSYTGIVLTPSKPFSSSSPKWYIHLSTSN